MVLDVILIQASVRLIAIFYVDQVRLPNTINDILNNLVPVNHHISKLGEVFPLCVCGFIVAKRFEERILVRTDFDLILMLFKY